MNIFLKCLFFFKFSSISQLQVVDAQGGTQGFLIPITEWFSRSKPKQETETASLTSAARSTVEDNLQNAVRWTESKVTAPKATDPPQIQSNAQTESKSLTQKTPDPVEAIKTEASGQTVHAQQHSSDSTKSQQSGSAKSTSSPLEPLQSVEKPSNKFGIRKRLVEEKVAILEKLMNGKSVVEKVKRRNVHFDESPREIETVKWDGWADGLEKSAFDKTMPSVRARAKVLDERIKKMEKIQRAQKQHKPSSATKLVTPKIPTPPTPPPPTPPLVPPRPSAQQTNWNVWSPHLEKSYFDETMPSVLARAKELGKQILAAKGGQPIESQPTPRRAKYGASNIPTPPPFPPRPVSHPLRDRNPSQRTFDEKRETVHKMLAGRFSAA